MAKTISRMQNRVRNIMLSDFRLQYKVTVAKTIWYWQKKQTHRLMESMNRQTRIKPMHLWAINL